MICRAVAEFLMQYIDGELPWRQRTTFEIHLADCHACWVYLKSYEQTVRLARTLNSIAVDSRIESVSDELVRLILESRSRAS